MDKGLLADRVAIVTGAARGIGAAIAESFISAGAHVIATDIDAAAGRAFTVGLPADRIEFMPHDIASGEDWARVMESCIARFGRLDVLVNNAGILVRGTIEETDEAMLERAWRVNGVGTFTGMKAAIAPMRASGGGSIINVSSVAATGGYPKIFAYATTKWAIRGMTKSAARALGAYGIRVNNILPGSIETDIIADVSDDVRQARIDQTPLGRIGIPQDIAGAAVFLASDMSSFMTGADVVVDAGLTL